MLITYEPTSQHLDRLANYCSGLERSQGVWADGMRNQGAARTSVGCCGRVAHVASHTRLTDVVEHVVRHNPIRSNSRAGTRKRSY